MFFRRISTRIIRMVNQKIDYDLLLYYYKIYTYINKYKYKYKYRQMVTIYVLRLEQRKFYVGRTNNYDKTMWEHMNGNGPEWIQKYPLDKAIECIPNCDNFDEDKYTIKYMNEFGIDNVRGGSFKNIHLTDSETKIIKQMITYSTEFCYMCGQTSYNNCFCTLYVPPNNNISSAYNYLKKGINIFIPNLVESNKKTSDDNIITMNSIDGIFSDEESNDH